MRRTALTRLVLVTLATAALSGCAEDGTTPRSSPLSEQVEDSTRTLECYSRFNGLEDCDGDGVVNSADVIPGRADLGDDDGDSVANKLDRYPSFDDRTFDIDNDGIADFQDTFFGNNNADVDGD